MIVNVAPRFIVYAPRFIVYGSMSPPSPTLPPELPEPPLELPPEFSVLPVLPPVATVPSGRRKMLFVPP